MPRHGEQRMVCLARSGRALRRAQGARVPVATTASTMPRLCVSRLSWVAAAALAWAAVAAGEPAAAPGANRKPSVIFCSEQADKPYMRHILTNLSIEVDYATPDDCGNRTRLWRYTAAVVQDTPGAPSQCEPSCDPAKSAAFAALLTDFAAAGGGVLLMPEEQNIRLQRLYSSTEAFGIKLPLSLLVETDVNNTARMEHMQVPIALTTNVTPGHPVTAGVRQLWYPTATAYNAQHTGPLAPAPGHAMARTAAESASASTPVWQCLVHAMATTATKPVDLDHSSFDGPPPSDRTFLPNGTVAPCLMAVRSYGSGGGKIAALNQWSQYTLGTGLVDYWLFEQQVMTRGSGGRLSDMATLLDNLWRWLAVRPPGVAPGLGGYTTNLSRLAWSNDLPGAKDGYNETSLRWSELDLEEDPSLWPEEKVFHGVVGLRTTLSGGNATVADYAAAAAGLDLRFLVFLEPFASLTNESFDKLKAECRNLSTANLTLWAGYTMPTNIGNHMYLWGPDVPLPDERFMSPCSCSCELPLPCPAFEVQPMYDNGTMSGLLGPSFHWMIAGAANGATINLGYYNFTSDRRALQMPDMRGFTSAALMYYKDGSLVEDATDQFLLTAEATLPPCPIAVNEVMSVEELARELSLGHAITHVRGPSLDMLWPAGLRWDDQYDYMPVFVAPMSLQVQAFGITPLSAASSDNAGAAGGRDPSYGSPKRVQTLGAARFVANRAVNPTAISVHSTVPLCSVSVYDGTALFRRFGPAKSPGEFYRTLLLNGAIQRNLVLVAEDELGGKAVTYAWKQWKDSGWHRAPVFCNDHVNDCNGSPLLSRGPFEPPVTWVEPIPADLQGRTWDGGNGAEVTTLLVTPGDARPVLETTNGETEVGARFAGTPRLEFSDEGCVATSDEQTKLYSDKIEQVANAWNTWGPFKGPSALMNFTARYRLLFAASVGWPHEGWAAMPETAGVATSVFRLDVTMKKTLTVRRLGLWSLQTAGSLAITLVYGKTLADPGTVVALTENNPPAAPANASAFNLTLAAGGWFHFASPNTSATSLFYVLGSEQVTLAVRPGPGGGVQCAAVPTGKPLRQGDGMRFELLSFGVTTQTNIDTVRDVLQLHRYLVSPDGLNHTGGARLLPERRPLLSFNTSAATSAMNQSPVQLSLPRPSLPHGAPPIPTAVGAVVPLQACSLVRRWSVGLFQRQGWVLPGWYNGTGANRYTALGLDVDGCAWAPLYVDRAPTTSVVVGHPVVIGGGTNQSLWAQIWIEVVRVGDAGALPGQNDSWVVTANNPTETELTVTFLAAWDMPGFPIPFSSPRPGVDPGVEARLPPQSVVTVARS